MMFASRAEDNPCEVLSAAIELNDLACVGAGIGGGFQNTHELRVMKYNEALLLDDKKNWMKAVEEEYQCMVKSNVFKVVDRRDLPDGATVLLSSTWAMKKKSNGTYRARLNARGFEQKDDGEHFNSSNPAAPVTNAVSVRIFMVIMLMARWATYMLDVKGAFLLGEFEDGEKIFMDVPQGFEKYYEQYGNVVLLLLQTIYGTKQAAMAYWRQMLRAFKHMGGFKRSIIDPCVQYNWTPLGLVIWLMWVEDCLCVGPKEAVNIAAKEVMQRFYCDDIGEMKEYVGCKTDIKPDDKWMHFTQPVMVQSFKDEFDIEDAMRRPSTSPGELNTIFQLRNRMNMSPVYVLRISDVASENSCI